MAGKILKTGRGNSNRSATLVVAASNATAKSKAVADYVCDGTADHVQIQAAIDSLNGHAAGGKVQLSEGLFSTSSPIVMKPEIALEGMACSEKCCIMSSANISSIISFASGVQNKHCRLAHMGLCGNSAGGYSVTWAIDAYNLDLSTIEDIEIQGVHGGGVYLRGHESGKVAWLNTLQNVKVDFNGTNAGGTSSYTYKIESTDNAITNCYGTGNNPLSFGFFIPGHGNGISLCHSDSSSASGYYVTGNSNSFTTCVSESNTDYGFYFYAASLTSLKSTITGCVMYLNSNTDIRFTNVAMITVVGNVCQSAVTNSIEETGTSDWNRFGLNSVATNVVVIGAL
jgi:hypothetical protein